MRWHSGPRLGCCWLRSVGRDLRRHPASCSKINVDGSFALSAYAGLIVPVSVRPGAQSVDVAIVGGGMVGLAVACGLWESGLRVAVLDHVVPSHERCAASASAGVGD